MTFFIELDHQDSSSQPTPPPPPSPDDGTHVGALLKARRRELGLKYKDVSREIKIKAEYVKAIEDEEFDVLPTPEYLRLFLKTYAEFLGFDIQEIYSVFDTQELPVRKPVPKQPEAPTPAKTVVPEKKTFQMTPLLWVGVGVVLAAFVVVMIIFGRKVQPGERVTTPPITPPAEDSALVAEEEETPQVVPVPPMRLSMTGRDSTWLVVQADGDTVFIGFMGEGDVRAWDADSSFALSLSHYDGVTASINGYDLKPFRQWGGPIRSRPITRQNLEVYLDTTAVETPSEEDAPL